ncbi:MAG: dienelactone hydrolase [Gemmataceae bacterium]|nr:dienelactone hydrolase [Gemmataceae bacterium]
MRYLLCLIFCIITVLSVPAQPATEWREVTQKPYANAKIPYLGLKPLLAHDGKPITTKDAWPAKRQELAELWQTKLGTFPKKSAGLEVKIESTEQCDGYQRQLLSFASAVGDRVSAYLLIPDGIKKGEKRPAVVVFHQTTADTLKEPAGLGKKPALALGVHLVKRGYVVLSPECYIMKAGGPGKQAAAVSVQWAGLTGMGKMVFDAIRCVDFLESLAYVDAQRIGCIGFSLGAKEVLYAMAFESRYKAGVFNEGGIGLKMSNWTAPWYLTEKMKEHIPTMENHQVLALCAPRPILLLGGDSADGDASWPFVHAVLPVYRLLGAEERIGLINHRGKHSYPQEGRRQSYRWLDHWLEHRPTSDEVGPS